MDIKAVYIVNLNGIPLISRHYSVNTAKVVDELVSPFLATIVQRFEEITGEGINHITLGDKYHLIFEEFGEIIGVVISSKIGDIPENTQLLTRKFYKQFRHELKETPRKVDMFDQFETEIVKILDINTNQVVKIVPKQALDTYALSEYSGITQNVIKEIIRSKEVNVSTLADRLKSKRSKIENALQNLVEDGYVGIKSENDTNWYFTL